MSFSVTVASLEERGSAGLSGIDVSGGRKRGCHE